MSWWIRLPKIMARIEREMCGYLIYSTHCLICVINSRYINALLWPVYTITSLLYCSHSVCFASESHVDCCMVLISNNGITQ